MGDFFLSADKWLFYAINRGWSNPITDFLMPVITNIKSWLPVIVAALAYAFYKDKRKAVILIFAMAIMIAISDQTSSNLVKGLVGRLRPCRELGGVHLLTGCGPGKSFPSSHAANCFAAATLLTYFYRKQRVTFYSIASLIALSRVFVGVHYPFDIICGAFLGTALALGFIYVLKKIGGRWPGLDVN